MRDQQSAISWRPVRGAPPDGGSPGSTASARSIGSCGFRLQTNERPLLSSRLHARLDAGTVVGLEIAERVLNAGEQMLEQRRHRVVPLVVAVRHVEQPSFTLTTDPAQCVVVIGPRSGFLRFVGV